uniref:Uncharacterized protein n=1 Tax=Cacopsylla melanoneura TaxID=428564 RepID=A0A8D8TC80_9HEMI
MRANIVALCFLAMVPTVILIPLYQFEEYADEIKGTTTPYTNPPLKTGIKERFKEFLRKAIYGITPTTIYTTLVPWQFPEEYDPIKLLEWQLAQEKLRGMTTPDHEPVLTDKTNLWDGYFNDPTFESITFYSMREEQANKSRPNRLRPIDRYWEPGWRGHRASDEAIAKMWKKWALEENKVYYQNHTTRKCIPLEDMTYDSVDKVKWVTNFGDSHWDSDDRRMLTQAEQEAWEEWMQGHGKYVYRGEPTTEDAPPTTYPPRSTTSKATIKRHHDEEKKKEKKKPSSSSEEKKEKKEKKKKEKKRSSSSSEEDNPIYHRTNGPRSLPASSESGYERAYIPTYTPKKGWFG